MRGPAGAGPTLGPMGRSLRSLRSLLLVPLVALPLAGCGDDDGEAGGGCPDQDAVPGAVAVGALDSLDFDADAYTAEAGKVTFYYENCGSLPHTLVIEGIDTDEFRLSVGDTDEGSIELEPGEYVLFCDIAGHRGGGMEATLTVE